MPRPLLLHVCLPLPTTSTPPSSSNSARSSVTKRPLEGKDGTKGIFKKENMIQDKRRAEEEKEEEEEEAANSKMSPSPPKLRRRRRTSSSSSSSTSEKSEQQREAGSAAAAAAIRNVESEIRTLKGLIPGLSEDRSIGEVSDKKQPNFAPDFLLLRIVLAKKKGFF